ncbi:hypothetical protein ACFY4C_19690 [Actinomadura viridis]|uniref:hypothetical protein n=1 Tax=Actinomadura viridis TaxID=58110 RepID=UPI003679828F
MTRTKESAVEPTEDREDEPRRAEEPSEPAEPGLRDDREEDAPAAEAEEPSEPAAEAEETPEPEAKAKPEKPSAAGEPEEKAKAAEKEPRGEAGEKAKAAEKGARGEAGTSRRVAMALAVIAALCAAWFGWSWYGAAHDESLHYSRTRDDVLRAGEQAVQNLNTLDYRSLNQGLKLWQDSSTNELYQQIVQGRPQFEQAVRKAQTITSAKVLDAAVTELDQHAGKASVIVALQITVTPPKGDPAIKKTRLMGQLTRTSTGWKLSALAQAPVGAAG